MRLFWIIAIMPAFFQAGVGMAASGFTQNLRQYTELSGFDCESVYGYFSRYPPPDYSAFTAYYSEAEVN